MISLYRLNKSVSTEVNRGYLNMRYTATKRREHARNTRQINFYYLVKKA